MKVINLQTSAGHLQAATKSKNNNAEKIQFGSISTKGDIVYNLDKAKFCPEDYHFVRQNQDWELYDIKSSRNKVNPLYRIGIRSTTTNPIKIDYRFAERFSSFDELIISASSIMHDLDSFVADRNTYKPYQTGITTLLDEKIDILEKLMKTKHNKKIDKKIQNNIGFLKLERAHMIKTREFPAVLNNIPENYIKFNLLDFYNTLKMTKLGKETTLKRLNRAYINRAFKGIPELMPDDQRKIIDENTVKGFLRDVFVRLPRKICNGIKTICKI